MWYVNCLHLLVDIIYKLSHLKNTHQLYLLKLYLLVVITVEIKNKIKSLRYDFINRQ